METARYFSTGVFGGRPRKERLAPSFFSIASRASSNSRSVGLRALSNGNSLYFGIMFPFFFMGRPCTDDTTDLFFFLSIGKPLSLIVYTKNQHLLKLFVQT